MWSADADPMQREEEEEENTPMVLDVPVVIHGEEDEDTIYQLRARKLYRFDRDKNQWEVRGCDTLLKLRRNRESGKVRLVLRDSATSKRIRANHLVKPTMSVKEHATNIFSCVWCATDFADGELRDEKFCIKFASIADKKSFMNRFREVAESQRTREENEHLATAAAQRLKNLRLESLQR